MATVKLVCIGCKNEFQKTVKAYNYQVSKGKSDFYCTTECFLSSVKNPLSPFLEILRSLKKRYWSRGKVTQLNLDFLVELWDKQKGICPYTGIKMELSGREKHGPCSASLDRIDSSKGYEKDNVEFVCLFINYGKNRFPRESVLQFLADVRR
jgi:hypothetical protein